MGYRGPLSPKEIRSAPSAFQRQQNAWQAELGAGCGKAIGDWLLENGGIHKPINALQDFELEGMAYAAIGKFTELRAKRGAYERKTFEDIAERRIDDIRESALSEFQGISKGRVMGVSAGFLCQLCKREATIWAAVPEEPKPREACCKECLAAIDIVLDEWGGEALMAHNLTAMERQAVKEARDQFFAELKTQGIADRFTDCSADQMDSVIKAIWEGLQKSMRRQAGNGDIPF